MLLRRAARMHKRWLLGPLLLLWVLAGGQAYAAGPSVGTQARLEVQPVDCVVDIVQNGNGQTLQIPAGSCLPVASSLLTPVLDQVPGSPSPTRSDAALPVVIKYAPAGGIWSPVAAAATVSQQSPVSSVGAVTAMVGGIGTIVVVTAIGVDGALFELGHSRSAVRWARGRFGLIRF